MYGVGGFGTSDFSISKLTFLTLGSVALSDGRPYASASGGYRVSAG